MVITFIHFYRCGFVASNKLCKACVLLEGLNKGRPKLAVGKSRDQRQLAQMPEKEKSNCCLSGTNGITMPDNQRFGGGCGEKMGESCCSSGRKVEPLVKAKTANDEIDF